LIANIISRTYQVNIGSTVLRTSFISISKWIRNWARIEAFSSYSVIRATSLTIVRRRVHSFVIRTVRRVWRVSDIFTYLVSRSRTQNRIYVFASFYALRKQSRPESTSIISIWLTRVAISIFLLDILITWTSALASSRNIQILKTFWFTLSLRFCSIVLDLSNIRASTSGHGPIANRRIHNNSIRARIAIFIACSPNIWYICINLVNTSWKN
jgi:hypothetical protein